MKQRKKDFPIFRKDKKLVYLDSASTSQKPQQVLDAVADFYTSYNANIHRGLYQIAEEATAKVDEVRRKVARFINADPSEIIFTKSSTEAINLVMYTWGEQTIQRDDVIVTTITEHHSNFVPWQQLAKKKEAKFKVIDIDNHGLLKVLDSDFIIQNLKFFGLTYVSNMLGTINPIKEIIKKFRLNNPKLKVLVDAAQAVPHMKIDVKDIDCDFLVFSGHKMLAETGIGVLYVKKELLDTMQPFLYGGDMIREVTISHTTFLDGPQKYEAGTLNISGIVSLGAAIDYLEDVGLEKVQEHEKKLMVYCREQMENIEGLSVYGPKDLMKRSGVVSFTVDGIHAHDVAQILADMNICVRSGHHCTMPLHKRLNISASTRASFYLYNDEEDVEAFIEGIKKVKKIFKS